MPISNPSPQRVLTLAALLFAGACADTPASLESDMEVPTPLVASADEAHRNGARVSPNLRTWVRELRGATRQFKDFDAAAPGGYVAQLSDCVASPAGGMGYHYGDPTLIDGQLAAMQPEILLYEPVRNGGLRFVGVEFIVPFAAWTDTAAPEVNGFPLHRNETLGLWVLHVWTERHNPSGVLEDFNPKVSCRFAPESA